MKKMLMILMIAFTMSGCYSSVMVEPMYPAPYYDSYWYFRAWNHPYNYWGYHPYISVPFPHHHGPVYIKPAPPRLEPRRGFGDTRHNDNRRH